MIDATDAKGKRPMDERKIIAFKTRHRRTESPRCSQRGSSLFRAFNASLRAERLPTLQAAWAFLVFCIAILFLLYVRTSSAAPRVINIGPSGTTDLGMRIVKTRHYELHTDLDPALVTDLSTRMDTMYDDPRVLWPDEYPPDAQPRIA